jgi:hypothetical protein
MSILHDRDIVTLPPRHKIAKLNRKKWIGIDTNASFFNKSVKKIVFYCYSCEKDKESVRKNIAQIVNLRKTLVEYLSKKYQKKVLHLSIAGSAIFKSKANDIDFNVIIEGCKFEYFEIFPEKHFHFFKNLGSIKKISFIVFGEKDINATTKTDDSIMTPGYLHQDIITREMLVYPWRNMLIYGYDVKISASKKFIIDRIVAGLAFAERILQRDIPRYSNNDTRILKSLSRINEAIMLLKIIR